MRATNKGKTVIQADKPKLLTLIAGVYAFYDKPFSAFAGDVWWESTKPYAFDAISKALTRHSANPDSGQFLPKPADVAKMLSGTSGDVAMSAWSKVERAMRSVGQYESVIFDDALIHRVVDDMGGWVKMCNCPSEHDMVFVAKEFQNRYRGFAMRSERPPYPAALVGMSEANNRLAGQRHQLTYRMLGDPIACRNVYAMGDDSSSAPIALLEVGDKGATVPLLGNGGQ